MLNLGNDKQISFDAAHNVNVLQFKCIAPLFALEEHGSFVSGELDRLYDPDPNETVFTNLTIADMVDFLNTGVMFEICNNNEVIVIMRYLNKYISMVENINNTATPEIADVLAKCKRLRNELDRLIRRIHPELYVHEKDTAPDDLFSQFGG